MHFEVFAYVFVGHSVFPQNLEMQSLCRYALSCYLVCATLVFLFISTSSHFCLFALYHFKPFLRLPQCLFYTFVPIFLCLFTLCPSHDLFLPFPPLLSNAQRARTVCIMYCIQPRIHMMNSRQSRAIFICEQSSCTSAKVPVGRLITTG